MNNTTIVKILPIPLPSDRLNTPVTIYNGTRNPEVYKQSDLSSLFKEMVNEDANISNRLKKAYEENKPEYTHLKENLFGFSIGTFNHRSDKDIEVYAPLLAFDIDGIQNSIDHDLHLGGMKICPYVYAALPSVSGYGIRLLVWCDSSPENHKLYYEKACKMLSEYLRIPTDKQLRVDLKAKGLTPTELKTTIKQREHIDTGTNNISRFWFYSHVPKSKFYLNKESAVFKIEPSPVKKQKTQLTTSSKKTLSESDKIDLCLKIATSRNIPEGRNHFVHFYSKLLYEHGINEQSILSECMKFEETDFGKPEIEKTVKSALKTAAFQKFSDAQMMVYCRKLNLQTPAPIEVKPIARQTKTKPKSIKAVDENEPQKKLNKFQQIKKHISDRYDFRLNEISIEIEYRRKGMKEYNVLNENDLIIELLESGYSSPDSQLMALLKSSFVPRYNPFQEYVNNLIPWNESQPDYITTLAKYVRAKDQEWFNLQFKKMLVRSLACALNVIPFNKHCFTLIGKQNDGKTSFLRFLCPDKLSDYQKENLDIHNKDGRISLCQNMFINLDELANFSKYDINKTKAFFTMEKVKERLPYDRKASNHLRRASFLASTNSNEFLTDETGNVRWLVFEIDGVYHDNGGKHGYNENINIDLVYSQAYHLLKSGFNFKMSIDDIRKSEDNNRNYQVVTFEQEIIQQLFTPASKEDNGAQFLTTTEIAQAIELKTTRVKIMRKNVGKALKVLGFEQSQKYFKEINGKAVNQQRKGYYVFKLE